MREALLLAREAAADGEVNFDMNPSRNSAYIVCDDGSLVVKVEGNWYRFERAE